MEATGKIVFGLWEHFSPFRAERFQKKIGEQESKQYISAIFIRKKTSVLVKKSPLKYIFLYNIVLVM